MFFRGDKERAFQHPQHLIEMVSSKCGPYHADVGRANLLGAALMAMTSQYDFALETCEAALWALRENKEVAGLDIEAAEFLKAGLEKLGSGEHPAGGEGHLIDQDTPIGKWLWRLRG